MIVRLSKCALLAGVALYFTLVVLNNVTDYDSNYQYVRHVLMMDTTFSGNHGMWRAVWSPVVHTVFYVGIICWEAATMAVCWAGVWGLARGMRAGVEDFGPGKRVAVAGLTMGCLLFLVAFLAVGGEWFLMWQSKVWDGRETAFRMFTVMAVVLVYVVMPYGE